MFKDGNAVFIFYLASVAENIADTPLLQFVPTNSSKSPGSTSGSRRSLRKDRAEYGRTNDTVRVSPAGIWTFRNALSFFSDWLIRQYRSVRYTWTVSSPSIFPVFVTFTEKRTSSPGETDVSSIVSPLYSYPVYESPYPKGFAAFHPCKASWLPLPKSSQSVDIYANPSSRWPPQAWIEVLP